QKARCSLGPTAHTSGGEPPARRTAGTPRHAQVAEKVADWGADCMGDSYSYIGAVVGATYPEIGKVLRKVMPKSFILVPGYGAQGGKGKDLVHYFNEDGLGAVVNSSRGIIAAYRQEAYAGFGAGNFADASRQAVIDMIEDIGSAVGMR
ncbi:MAG: orotidine 5'-phosphate decarboxylase, partial [Lachnospiraceae bacterium]|nr:orotidine 5'-phosphate decarboxylase [Lachnospiraceae bacterium]